MILCCSTTYSYILISTVEDVPVDDYTLPLSSAEVLEPGYLSAFNTELCNRLSYSE